MGVSPAAKQFEEKVRSRRSNPPAARSRYSCGGSHGTSGTRALPKTGAYRSFSAGCKAASVADFGGTLRLGSGQALKPCPFKAVHGLGERGLRRGRGVD